MLCILEGTHLWQEGVEAQNELLVAPEQLLHPLDDALSVDSACKKRLR
jgi:hypothetical protein